ncbi:MAG: class I SAM-dependent methyltransferase [Candidatus Eisenbacteria sp.]|nr:class I SAM-dependent methyltransferase [Candidatus Eisenbacteria bacterium]
MHSHSQYTAKQVIQEAEYAAAYHWSKRKRLEWTRYWRLTNLLADLISGIDSVRARSSVSICDFGCGDGRGSYELWQILNSRGFKTSLVGVDRSQDAIAWAKAKTGSKPSDSHSSADTGGGRVLSQAADTDGAPQARPDGGCLSFRVADIDEALRALPDDGSPPVVVMREVIEHLSEDEIDTVLTTIRRRAPSACLLVTTPSTNSPVEAKHFRHYTPESLSLTMERNSFAVTRMLGYAFRPSALFRPLQRAKGILDRLPLLWRLMNVAWRTVPPGVAITLVCMAAPSVPAGSQRA